MKTNCHILSFFFSFSCQKIIGCLSHHYAPELSHFNSLYCLLFSSHDICAENLVRNQTNFHHLILSFLLIPSQPDGVQTIFRRNNFQVTFSSESNDTRLLRAIAFMTSNLFHNIIHESHIFANL